MKRKTTSLILLLMVGIYVSCEKGDAGLPTAVSFVEVTQSITTDTLFIEHTAAPCPCFSELSLQKMMLLPNAIGWWSDQDGCRTSPYDGLMEIWISNSEYIFNVQAGTIKQEPFVSSVVFNKTTGTYERSCGGFTTDAHCRDCLEVLKNYIQKLRAELPGWNYCHQFPG